MAEFCLECWNRVAQGTVLCVMLSGTGDGSVCNAQVEWRTNKRQGHKNLNCHRFCIWLTFINRLVPFLRVSRTFTPH